MTGVAIALIVIALVLVRTGWGRARRVAVAGWALAVVSLSGLGWLDGAWGIAVGVIAACFVALLMIAYAALTSPSRPVRRSAETTAALFENVALPENNGLAIGRRLLVFLMVVPLSFLAAQWFAFALNAAMKGDMALDANSVALMMFVQPVIWTILMAWQMTLSGTRAMLLPPALAAVPGILIWMLA